jgi:hypothetical protein
VKRRDPVTPDVAAFVLRRDGGCVGPVVGMPGLCSWRIELDHIDGGGLGRRGPSTPDNLVSLCSGHHRYKTEHARVARPILREHVATAQAESAEPRNLDPYPMPPEEAG